MGSTIFDDLIKKDSTFKDLEQDIGLRLISEELDFKVNVTEHKLTENIKEVYNPREELALLAHLTYKIGYIRFKQPLKVKANIKNLGSELSSIYRGMRFTDGADLYYSDTDANILPTEEVEATFVCKNVFKKSHTIGDCTLFYHIPTNTLYTDFVGADISINGESLKYSQNFIDWEADCSYEIDGDKNVKIVIMLNNEQGKNIKLGDIVDVVIETAPNTKVPPDGLMVVEDGYDVVINSDTVIVDNYIPPMDIPEMRDYIKYGRQNIGDIVLNEDYRQFVLRNIGGIDEIKVWQEREETAQNGWDITNINKVFVSYISNEDNNSKITNLIEKYIYGKEVRHVPKEIESILVNIIITTTQAIPQTTINHIKDLVSGYYDGVHREMKKEVIYTKVFQELLKDIDDFALNIELSNIPVYKNELFYQVLKNDIAFIVS